MTAPANIASGSDQRALHLFTLWNFAVTAPLLTALSKQTVFIHDVQIGVLEVLLLLVLLALILPAACCLLDRGFDLVSQRIRNWGRDSVFASLFALLLLSLLRPYVANDWLLRKSLAGTLTVVLAGAGASLLTLMYQRLAGFRTWLTIASVGLVIFPGFFVWQFLAIQREQQFPPDQIALKNPISVVMVVFDEFSGTTLMNDKMEIDEQRFPNFARLAKRSTWYRNATTVHPRTDVAVPTILSGRLPTVARNPLANEYPGNLLQIIELTRAYDMAVFEPVCRLCPDSVREAPAPQWTSLEKYVHLVQTLATVYPRLLLPSDTPFPFPTIPRSWFGVSTGIVPESDEAFQLTKGLFNYPGSEVRNRQLQHFLKCVAPADRPRFCFLHTVFPHYPWNFLPTGQQYQVESAAARFPAGAGGELGEDWQEDSSAVLRNQFRYRLQVGFADRFIGQLMDRLEQTGMIDECLFVVTGDHGVSFRANHSRRIPDADNLADIVSVPLFIKFPGQTQGQVDDSNVESVDLMPTIAEVLGIHLQDPVDGVSLKQATRRPRKTLYFNETMTIIEPDVPQRAASVRQQFAVFGDRELDRAPASLASHPDWHGRPLNSFTITGPPIRASLVDPLKSYSTYRVLNTDDLVAGFLMGIFHINDLPETPADLVVAVDGIVQDSGKSLSHSGRTQIFEFLLPRAVMQGSSGRAEIYVVDRSQKELCLRPLAVEFVNPE